MTVEEITAAMNAENFEMTEELRKSILNDYKASAEALAKADENAKKADENAKQIEALTKERDEVIAERDKIKKEYADKFGNPPVENDTYEKLENEVLKYFKNKI